MKRALMIVAGVLVGLSLSTPAYATDTSTTSHHVVDSPDDGTPPWARDTFDRETKITKTDTGFTISFTDTGSFKTAGGAKGSLKGEGKFVVIGGTEKVTPPPSTFDRSGVPVKDDFTSSWWKRFVDGGETAGISDWKWTYKTECETRVETPDGVKGDYPKGDCPQGHNPIPSPSKSSSPSASHSVPPQQHPTPHTSGPVIVTGNSLPVTGPTGGVFVVGAGVLAIGAALVLLARRRRSKFES